MNQSDPKPDQLEGCDGCGLSSWACNRLQDLVYDDMSISQRKNLAVEIRKHSTRFIHQREAEARKKFAQELAYSNDWRILIEAELTKQEQK